MKKQPQGYTTSFANIGEIHITGLGGKDAPALEIVRWPGADTVQCTLPAHVGVNLMREDTPRYIDGDRLIIEGPGEEFPMDGSRYGFAYGDGSFSRSQWEDDRTHEFEKDGVLLIDRYYTKRLLRDRSLMTEVRSRMPEVAVRIILPRSVHLKIEKTQLSYDEDSE